MRLWFVVASVLTLVLTGCGKKEAPIVLPDDPVAQTSPPQSPGTQPASEQVRSTDEAGKTSGEAKPRPSSSSPSNTTILGDSRPPRTRPTQPPADQVSSRFVEYNGSRVQLEGCCKVSEDSVTCWDAEGANDDGLAQRVKAALLDNRFNQMYRLSFAFGKKNRLVVFSANRRGGMPGQITVAQVGDDYTGGGMSGIDLNRTPDGSMIPPETHFDVKSVAVDATQTTTRARLIAHEQANERPTLEARVGASAKVAGVTYTVASVGPFTPKGNNYSHLEGPYWQVVLQKSGTPERVHQLSVHIIGKNGQPASFADPSGSVIDQEAYSNALREASSKGGPGYSEVAKRYRSGTVFPVNDPVANAPSGTLTYAFAINPKNLGKFSLTGIFSKTFDLTDIPLDPR